MFASQEPFAEYFQAYSDAENPVNRNTHRLVSTLRKIRVRIKINFITNFGKICVSNQCFLEPGALAISYQAGTNFEIKLRYSFKKLQIIKEHRLQQVRWHYRALEVEGCEGWRFETKSRRSLEIRQRVSTPGVLIYLRTDSGSGTGSKTSQGFGEQSMKSLMLLKLSSSDDKQRAHSLSEQTLELLR